MANQKWKLGVATFVATALISTSTLTGASVDAASTITKVDMNKQSYTSNWQSNLMNSLLNKISDSNQTTITIGNWKFNLQTGFCIYVPNLKPEVTPVPTATVTPTATVKPSATPAPTVKPTATPAPTIKPTATVKPSATPAPTIKPTATVKPSATPTPTVKPTATPAPGGGNSSVSATQNEILKLVNAQRASAGLSALSLDASLNTVAMEKARDMDVNNYFSHNSPTYGSPFDMLKTYGVSYSYAGENIATGQTSAAQVMNDWMNSSGHRANILSANFTKIGVGYVNGEWVQIFIG
ncbi:MAG: CAP domain-containing protein [Candidatus Pristimantibacillus lignocellulolyticus]|uniref:CAP domain-containing protein n=1 Tax=Candidatus Pristimantibacillus lignocellulolyticus TaxID=2994561 RepID=A0A9J6ZF98_9BACL|nr:MAG: CAP domain-containing protein [Candidatus Pristimantibacillus lignocellulolyticus]